MLVDRAINRPSSHWELTNCLRLPDGTVMSTADQELPGWGFGTTSLTPADFSGASQFISVPRRSTNDLFLQSVGLVASSTVVALNAPLAINQGWLFETVIQAPSGGYATDCYILKWSWFTLHLDSAGICTVWDSRDVARKVANGLDPTPYAIMPIATEPSILGKFLRLRCVPYNRGSLLIYSNLGGWFAIKPGARFSYMDANTGGSTFVTGLNVITESAMMTITPLPGQQAFFQFSPYTFQVASGDIGVANTIILPELCYACPDIDVLADAEFGGSVGTATSTPDSTPNIGHMWYGLTLYPGTDYKHAAFVYHVSVKRDTSHPPTMPTGAGWGSDWGSGGWG